MSRAIETRVWEMNVIPEEILNLQRVRYFTPNERARIMREANVADFEAWCRREETRPLLPSLAEVRDQETLVRKILGYLP